MNRGNCRKTTEIPEYEYCVVDNETNKIYTRYITKPSAEREAKKFNETFKDSVKVEKIKNPNYENYWKD